MDDRLAALKPILYGISDAAVFLFTKPAGIAILGAALLAAAGARLWSAVSDRALAHRAAGEDFGRAAAAGAALRELVAMGVKAAAALPAMIGIAAVLIGVIALSDATRKVDEFVAAQKRISELSATVRNLQRRYKAVEVRVEEAKEGRIKAQLSFFDYGDPKAPPSRQTVEMPGREIFIDAIVCNFAYSEIAAGSAVNLAIPYKIFSDELPEARGIPLALLDGSGEPLMYHRSADQVYGISPEAFGERLGELMKSMRSDDEARGAGIVRSLYGDAVHKAAKAGESFAVWVEQSGGLSIKDSSSF